MDGEDRHVVVGVDGSAGALRAVRWAAREAARHRWSLRLVNALDWTEDHVVGHPGLGSRQGDIRRAVAERALAAAAATAGEDGPDVPGEQAVVIGYPISVLAGEARRAELLVVGARGLSRVAGLLLGSVSTALAAHAACPVVVVRGEDVAGLPAGGAVVVGVDGSPAAESALAFAFDAASRRGAPLVAVHARRDAVPGSAASPHGGRASGEGVLTERLAGWSEKYPDVAVRRVLDHADPAAALLAEAAGAQLLVVGTRGRSGVAGPVLGSVGNAVLHRSPCPVAVVRPDPVGHR
jgi:nucleotide-binding universal stress UspA family protein